MALYNLVAWGDDHASARATVERLRAPPAVRSWLERLDRD